MADWLAAWLAGRSFWSEHGKPWCSNDVVVRVTVSEGLSLPCVAQFRSRRSQHEQLDFRSPGGSEVQWSAAHRNRVRGLRTEHRPARWEQVSMGRQTSSTAWNERKVVERNGARTGWWIPATRETLRRRMPLALTRSTRKKSWSTFRIPKPVWRGS